MLFSPYIHTLQIYIHYIYLQKHIQIHIYIHIIQIHKYISYKGTWLCNPAEKGCGGGIPVAFRLTGSFQPKKIGKKQEKPGRGCNNLQGLQQYDS